MIEASESANELTVDTVYDVEDPYVAPEDTQENNMAFFMLLMTGSIRVSRTAHVFDKQGNQLVEYKTPKYEKDHKSYIKVIDKDSILRRAFCVNLAYMAYKEEIDGKQNRATRRRMKADERRNKKHQKPPPNLPTNVADLEAMGQSVPQSTQPELIQESASNAS